MGKISRHCPKCKRFMPYDWSKPQCKFCGSRVKLDVLGGAPMWDGLVAELGGWRKKKFKPTQRITGREDEAKKIVSLAETPRTNLSSQAPFVLFAGALLTLGVSSAVRILRLLLLINESLRYEECVRVNGFFIWIFSHIAALCMFGWTLWGYTAFLGVSGGDLMEYLRISWVSWKIPLALLYFSIAFLMSRYYLFWIRNAIAEEAMNNAKNAVDRERSERAEETRKGRRLQKTAEMDESCLFARAPLLLWYFGVAYLQLHINRAQRRGLLTEASFRIPEPEPEAAEEEKLEKPPEDVPA